MARSLMPPRRENAAADGAAIILPSPLPVAGPKAKPAAVVFVLPSPVKRPRPEDDDAENTPAMKRARLDETLTNGHVAAALRTPLKASAAPREEDGVIVIDDDVDVIVVDD